MKYYPFSVIFILFFSFNSSVLYSQNLNDYLIAYWSFDDSTAIDNTGHGYNGVLVNNPQPAVGVSGSCFRFVGKNRFIEVSESKSLIGDYISLPKIPFEKYNEFSITLWVNKENFAYDGGTAYIFFGEVINSWAGVYHAGKYPNPTQFVKFSTGSIDDVDEPIKFSYNQNEFDNQWMYYAITYKDKIMTVYVNGILIDSKYQPFKISDSNAGIATHWWYFNSQHRQTAGFTGRIDEVKIYSKALTIEEIRHEINPCNSWVSYPNFANATGLSYVNDAVVQGPNLRLTPNLIGQTGAAWEQVRIPTNMNFTTDFSFKFTGGSNEFSDDGSLPGADGIAFVIQNEGPNAVGTYGGGIGYSSIKDAVAVEYDTFFNSGESVNDPNGNHIALQISKDGAISSLHSSDYTLAMNKDIIPLENGTIYYSRIDYNYSKKELKVYLDKELPNDTLVIDYSPIDIPSLIGDKYNLAYMGFTAATGNSVENHFISSWTLCGDYLPTSIYEPDINSENGVNPNPAIDQIEINFDNERTDIQSIEIYNYIGVRQKTISANNIEYDSSSNTLKLNVSDLEKGIYFIIIRTSNNEFSRKFVKV